MLLPYADSLRRLDMLRKSWEKFIGVGPPSMPSLSILEEKVKANVNPTRCRKKIQWCLGSATMKRKFYELEDNREKETDQGEA